MFASRTQLKSDVRWLNSAVLAARGGFDVTVAGPAVLVAAHLGLLVSAPSIAGASGTHGRNRVTNSQDTPQDEMLSEADLAAVAAGLADGELDDDVLGMVSGGLSCGEA